ncbi:MAG: NAD(P)/FAD-dependent oxidoreductase, partial [Rubrivivax sp.]|nr:NAD(P)/FAD-dependent oxidoreductase [Rubrivivax sp.]
MRPMKLVVVGNGMAGMRTVEELLRIAPDLYDITVFGAEPHPNYNRILLSPVLAGEQTIDEIVLNPLSWYAEHGITLHAGKKATSVDRRRRIVTAADGTCAAYDRLLLATGSNPFILPVPGRDLDGVVAYRDIADTEAMIDAAGRYRHAVVIGGGLLGLEAANGLAKRGMHVSVVHLMPWLMERQLDETAGRLLQKSLEARGLRFFLGTQTEALVGDAESGAAGRVMAVRFKDGREIPADLVVMAAGIRPNTELAEKIGLHCQRGVVVTDTLQTVTDARIYAVGECAAHRGVAYGLVAPLFEQAKVCATHLAEFGIGRYTGSQVSTKLKVTGIDLFSAGDFMGGDGAEEIVLSDPIGGVYKKLVIKDDRLVGACLYGDTVDGSWYFKLLRDRRPIGDIRDHLMFGEANLGDTGHQGQNRALAMADTDEVCGCNGVTKGAICKAIKDKGLFTLEDVRKHTKASASCGSCTGLVEQLLMATAGADYSATPTRKAMCGCTDLTHGEVRAAIREQHLLAIPDVYAALGWRSPNGCATCRPAVNYYLISTWPKEAQDDPQSRFVNERSHANIQKDGTYSVVPRMWGGETTADELRRIAAAVDKYKIPTVKVTGGQRIDLLGVKKEDLPNVWADIGMPSGHAYAKALRTVKTCVGSEWCRFGTQDSTRMGKDLERALWRMYAPHKVKLAVSGCPRNCAEAGIKDVGVIGVESGWELYVAGNGGIKTEVAQFLAKVKTA